jgi:large subunit ribosomal protein L3
MSEETAKVADNASLNTFFGVKAGMTRIFDKTGNHVPVTVIKLIPNVISQVKTADKDGYEAYQVAYFDKREKNVSKPLKGHLKKANIDKAYSRFAEVKADSYSADLLGKEISLDSFENDTYVDVTGTSKGKGFAGVMKRYGFQGGPASHGSHFHRSPGSIGNRATPGRVFAEKKMPGHMGDKTRTVQNLKVVEVNKDEGYMLIKGSIPGSKNSIVKVAKALKKA